MVLATSSGEPSRRRGICLTNSSVPGDRDGRVDLTGRDGVHTHPQGAEIRRHFPGERRQRRLGSGIGAARIGMHAAAGDGGDVDHRSLRRLQLFQQAVGECKGSEKVHLKHLLPGIRVPIEGSQSLSIWPLW